MTAKCELCGEPMPEGEQMFKYHGYSGNCPKPPKQKTEVMAEFTFRDMREGGFWIDVAIERKPYTSLGPFDTQQERRRAYDDLLAMTRSVGAKDMPSRPQ